MGYSAWSIWCHPRRAARMMEGLETNVSESSALCAENAALREELERLRKTEAAAMQERDNAREENERLTQEKADLAAQNAMRGQRVSDLERELSGVAAELEEYRDLDSRLREFEELLTRAEDMKRRYEERIARLRARIKEMKTASGDRNPEADELTVIDMRSASETSHAPEEPEEDTEPDWLEQLPD